MYPEAYKEWIGLFNDDFMKIWESERKELRKVALLLSALQLELTNVQTNVEIEVSNLKQQLKYRDDLEKKKLTPRIGKQKSPNTINKENILEKEAGLKSAGDVPSKKNQSLNESPDLFRNVDLNAHCSSTDVSFIDLSISEDDATKIEGSPTIKKRRKRYKILSNQTTFSSITENEEKPTTPVTNIRESVKTNLFKTPCPITDHDLSVIDCTPEMSIKRAKTSNRISDFLSKKKSKNKKNNKTLTQMFRSPSVKTSNEKKEDVDSDETYFEDSMEETKLGITDLIHYINKDETTEQKSHVSTLSRLNEHDHISQELETSSQDIDQFSRGGIFNEEDMQTSDEKSKFNAYPEPVVRGKARKQLHGWSCQQCKNFYGQMKLSPEELQKKMDECSRHRYKYHPPEETMPGFWNLSIPSEK